MTIEWDVEEFINEAFRPLLYCRDRYMILYGGRGSSKSDFATKKLVYDCLTQQYFRFILCRETYNVIKDSQYQSIKDTIMELGLSSLFTFKLQPLEIHCINGNSFIARGRDEIQRIKSVKDPTGVWYEEEIPAEEEFITITTSIRTLRGNLQEIFTINPEVNGDYTEHWFYKKFFGTRTEKSFCATTTVEIEKDKFISVPYTVHHSTHRDNKFLPDTMRAILENYKHTDEYYYTIYTLGRWGNKITGGNFYKHFNRGRNVKQTEYNENSALHISFDFNVNPYMTCSLWQMHNNIAQNIGEIIAEYPKNTTLGICNEFKKMFPHHNAGLFVYGDPAGRHEDTRQERGRNDFTIITDALNEYRPTLRVHSVAPSVVLRGQWINEIFLGNRSVSVTLSENSPNLITDLLNIKEGEDGKYKQKVKDKKTGVTYEKWGHLSDGMDYFLTHVFANDFAEYQKRGGAKIKTGRRHFAEENSY
jgi:PBSX family phage terminase large subunit